MNAKRLRTIVQLLICVSMLLSFASPAFADSEGDAPDAATLATAQNDDSALEVGVWYVQDYENCPPYGLPDLGGVRRDALGARDRLGEQYFVWIFPYPTPQWTPRYTYGNTSAWEEDWKGAASGGTEEYYIDNVDLAYFSGHGGPNEFYFGKTGNKHDDCFMTKADAFAAWGTKDLDWVVLSACQTLNDPYESYRYWARTMNGLRLIMGMKTNMSDVYAGEDFAWYVRWNNTMTYSWFRMANNVLPSSEIVRVMAEHSSYFNDRWSNHTSPTTVDSFFSLWTHRAKTPIVAVHAAQEAVDLSVLNGEMPVFQVQTLSTDQANERWGDLNTAFQLTNTTPISGTLAVADTGLLGAANNNLYVSDDGQLVMDSSAGLYQYVDGDEIWQYDEAALGTADAEGMLAISPDTARDLAEQFLTDNSLLLGGATFQEVAVDTITELEDPARFARLSVAAATPLIVLQETDTNYTVTWGRTISYTVPGTSAAGADQVLEFPVVGPGGRIDVFVDTTVPATVQAQALMQEAVHGSKGGYRAIGTVGIAGTDEILTTPVLPVATIKTLYAKIPEKVALGFSPIPSKSDEVEGTPTQGYWEGPIAWELDQLIPVYILNVKATLEDNSTQTHEEYVPVHNQYMAPYAEIIAPEGAESALPGTEVVFTAADASKTLAALGVDPSLTFALGSGDPDSYTYDWYEGEVSDGTKLGTGMTLPFTLPETGAGQGKPMTIKLILVVTDTFSPRDPKIASDELLVTFNKVYLPATSN